MSLGPFNHKRGTQTLIGGPQGPNLAIPIFRWGSDKEGYTWCMSKGLSGSGEPQWWASSQHVASCSHTQLSR